MAISNRLENAYQRAVTETQPREIFLAIIEYLELYLSDPKLESATDAIWTSMLKSHETRESYRLAAIEELRKFANGTRLDLESSDFEAVGHILQRIHNEREISAEAVFNELSKISAAFDSVFKATSLTHYDAYKNFMIKAEANPTYLLEQSRENLLRHYRCVQHYETYRPSLEKTISAESLSYLDNLNIEMQNLVLNKHRGDLKYLQVTTLRIDLQRWHANMADFFADRPIAQDKTTINIKAEDWDFNPDTATFRYGSKSVNLHKGKDNAKIMALLTQNPEISKIWSWQEIFLALESPANDLITKADEGKQPKIIKQKYDSINTRLQKRTRCEDFLTYSIHEVKINPRYLKSP